MDRESERRRGEESLVRLRVKWTVDKINRDERNFQPSHTWSHANAAKKRETEFRIILFVLPSISLSPSHHLSFSLPPFPSFYSTSRENTSEEFSATRSRWYPEGNLLTRSKFSSRKSFEKSHPEFKGKPFIWDLQYGTLSPPLRHFIPSSFFSSSKGIRVSTFVCIMVISAWCFRNLNASERYHILKLIISVLKYYIRWILPGMKNNEKAKSRI